MADENDLNIGINVNPAGAEAGSKRAGAAVKGIAGNTKELEQALNRLRSSVDPTFAAMQRYNKAHADNLALLRADAITRKEYNAGMKAAKAAMESEIEAINRRSAAGRQAAAEERARRAQERAEQRASAQAEAAAAREAAQARRAAERGAREESRRLAREEAAVVRQAAAEARIAAQEKVRAERQAAAEQRRAASDARRQEKADAREAARVVREAAREKLREEKAAARDAATAVREQKRAEREATRTAVAEAKAAAREKLAAERQAARGAAEAERDAKRQATQAAREAAAAAKQSARERAQAERDAARAAREAAQEIDRQAKAERAAAEAAAQLRGSIDPAFAAQQRYNETMRTATSLLMQNKLRTGEWIAIQKQAKAQMDVNVRSMGRQNSMYVQLGYQAQDVTASLASGINPLVILAQQGGQTAAALSTMGGTAGRVAAFFAGPWGAAIIGATLLLGYLWESMKEGETATKDLMNTEDRRRMSLKELTEAVKEYERAQAEANETTLQGATNQAYATAEARNAIFTEYQKAQDRLRRAQDALNNPMPGMDAEAIGGLAIEAWLAQRAVDSLKGSYESAVRAAGESRAAYVQATSEMTKNEIREQSEQTAALGAFRREWQAAGTDAQKQAAATARYQAELGRIQTHYNALKEKEAQARRDNARAAREEERATFSSRQDAIGVAGRELRKRGYSVGENAQFGGVKGSHPGMGNAAHGQYAIDINMPGFGRGNPEAANAAARRKMDEMVQAYQARGFRVLWNGKVYEPHGQGASYDIRPGANQHRDHAHMEAPRSIVGKPQGGQLGNQMVQELRQAEEELMQERLANFEFEQELNRENLAEVLRIQDEKIAAIKAFYGADSKEAIDAGRERIRIERNTAREQLDIRREQIDQTLALMMQGYETEKSLADLNLEERRAVIGFAEQQGVISARDALIAKAALLDQEYQNEVAHQNRMHQARTGAIRAQLNESNLLPQQRRRLQDELERAESEHLGRMRVLNANYTRDVGAMQREAQAIQMGKWREFASSFSGSLSQAMQGLWMRNMTLQQAFINMADQQIFRLMDMGAKAVENWIMDQFKITGAHQAAEAAKTAATAGGEAARTAAATAGATARTGITAGAAATEQGIQTTLGAAAVAKEAIKTGAAVTGAATQTGVAATAGMGELTTNAAVAAAGAYKSTVVIPFIGPVAAPAAAALALAAVLGFGALISSSGGQGEVPRDGQLSMLHKKETVLPAWIAEPMRQMFVSPRSSSGMIAGAAGAGAAVRNQMSEANSASFYYQPNNNNYDASLDTLLRRDGQTMRKWLKLELRKGGLKLK